MSAETPARELCGHFARLLGYPGENLAEEARACAALLGEGHPATAPVGRFAAYAAGEKTSRMEELYTATFDLQPLCHPYVGYQLCGESRQRALFLVRLREIYRLHGFAAGPELPDHLAEILRFLAGCGDEDLYRETVSDGLLPAVEKLLLGFDSAGHPYRELLSALRAFLAREAGAEGAPCEEVTA